MEKLSFSEIHLSMRESVTLRIVQHRPIRKNTCFERLERLGFVTDNWVAQDLSGKTYGDDGTMVSTDTGIDYLHYRHGFFWSELRNWASLIIAIAAFIKSFFF